MKIRVEVIERAGWWSVKVCGLRHSRYRSQAAARYGAKRLAARLQKRKAQARSQGGPYAARAAPARCALRVVLHPDAVARATLILSQGRVKRCFDHEFNGSGGPI